MRSFYHSKECSTVCDLQQRHLAVATFLEVCKSHVSYGERKDVWKSSRTRTNVFVRSSKSIAYDLYSIIIVR